MGLGAYSVYTSVTSEFYYYFLGMYMTSLAASLFVNIDRWAGTGVLLASDRVERYLEQA